MNVAVEPIVHLATSADRPVVRALLAEARLPVEDLDLAPELTFWVVRDDANRPIGAIGLERHGDVGLLRSLVVTPAWRRHGFGRTLVTTLENDAITRGITQLVLLTETAETFFHRLGYTLIERDRAPSAVASSAEFRTLCPSTAVCMTKRLSPSRR
jgi:N-acetylglutamate synthase-like GNAT family acetyltransferase